MSKIRVNSIVNANDDGGPTFLKGAKVSDGTILTVQGNVNVSGVMTASNFVGNGAGLTGLPVVSAGSAWAYNLLIDVLPYRA